MNFLEIYFENKTNFVIPIAILVGSIRDKILVNQMCQ